MDFFDRLLPKPIRNEEFLCYSDRSPDVLIRDMRELFERNRGWALTPNLYGSFTSRDTFRVRPKWSLLVINRAMTGPAVRMRGEVRSHGTGSIVAIELIAHWTLGLFVMFPILLVLVVIIMVPKERWAATSMEDFVVPVCFLLSFITLGLAGAWISKKLFKRNFVRYFKLRPEDRMKKTTEPQLP